MPSPDPRNHRAVVFITHEELTRLLDLPDGLQIQAIHGEAHRMAIALLLVDTNAGTADQQLAAVRPGDVAPDYPLGGSFAREYYSVEQGDGTAKAYVRFGWEPDPDPAEARVFHNGERCTCPLHDPRPGETDEPATVGGLVEGLRKTGASPDVLAAAIASEARQRKHPIVPLGSDTVAPHEY